MAASADEVRSAVQQLAAALLDDAERIAGRNVARMQELLPSYAQLPENQLISHTLTNLTHFLGIVCDPDAFPTRAEDHFRMWAKTRVRQGITVDETLQAWRIGLEVVREEAHRMAAQLELPEAAWLEFVDATLRWGDIGMRLSTSAHKEAEIVELERLAAEQAALRRVATLVAEDAAPGEMFNAVVREVGTLFGADFSGMIRYDADPGSITIVANWAAEADPPAPRRYATVPGDVMAMIAESGQPTRVDDWAQVPGPMAEIVRQELRVKSSVASPIIVNGRLWGAVTVHATHSSLPPDTESRLLHFTELIAIAIANAASREGVRHLAEEQAALRRVATLVARKSPPEDVFGQVATELGLLLGVEAAAVWRYEHDADATIVGVWGPRAQGLPVGTRFSLDGDSASALVYRSQKPVRVNDFDGDAGLVAARAREAGLRSVCSTPIFVGGRLWGSLAVASARPEPILADAERRMVEFTELVAASISDLHAQAEVEELAHEQEALRRVAELVAREATQTEIFAAIAEEIGQLLGTAEMRMMRYEGDSEAVVVASAGALEVFPVGSRWPLEGENVASQVYRTGQPARIDDYATKSGAIAEGVRSVGIRGVVGTPILVQAQIWGAMVTATLTEEPLPPDTDARLSQFTELMATAIANAEARGEVERLAEEQAALRRVATLVAEGVEPAELFAAVTREAEHVFSVTDPSLVPSIIRFDPGPEFVLVGAAQPMLELPVGSRWGPRDLYVSTRVLRTGRSARVEGSEVTSTPGAVADLLRRQGFPHQVGSPIIVEGRLWGAMTMNSSNALPANTGERLESFTELVATAIANAESREALRRLADEQAALRRVATLVAEGAPPSSVFEAVAAEMNQVLGADGVTLSRYEPDDEFVVLANSGPDPATRRLPAGTRVKHRGENVTTLVRSSSRSARLEHHAATPRALANIVGPLRVRASVGAPIIVDGRLWGVAVANWTGDESPPGETEERMAKFAELLDTAIANADSRDQLTGSRARLLTEADDARRRVVRDLHDGAQQRLVHTIVTLKLAQRALRSDDEKAESLVGEALEHAQRGNAELRELAHGILPAVLTQGGLRSGVNTIVSRLDLPVDVVIPPQRFPADIEASAYFVVAEALTNVVKHAHAASAEVRASVDDGLLRVEVQDDGVGGADPDGHGLVGLGDRVTALGGRLRVENGATGGTLLAATFPLSAG